MQEVFVAKNNKKDINEEAFEEQRLELEQKFHGQFVTFANGQLVAVRPTREEAIKLAEMHVPKIYPIFIQEIGKRKAGRPRKNSK